MSNALITDLNAASIDPAVLAELKVTPVAPAVPDAPAGEDKPLNITPTGYKILVRPLTVPGQTKGGVIIPDQVRDREQGAAMVGEVLDIGPGAYTDPTKTPGAVPYCKIGDYVLYGMYSGMKITLKDGGLLRLLNDDEIAAVVDDPAPFLL